MMIYYYLAAFIFVLGLVGTLVKKDLISILLCIELMLTSVNLLFTLFSKSLGVIDAQVLVFFFIIVAAAESAIGISLIITLFRKTKSAYSDDVLIYSE